MFKELKKKLCFFMLVELTIFTMHSVARWRQWTSKRNRGVLTAQKEGENGEKEPPRKNMSQTAGALVCSPTGDGGREGENGKNLDKSKTEPRSFLLSFPVPYSVLHTQEKRGKGIGRGTHGEREGMREKETSKRRGPLSEQHWPSLSDDHLELSLFCPSRGTDQALPQTTTSDAGVFEALGQGAGVE